MIIFTMEYNNNINAQGLSQDLKSYDFQPLRERMLNLGYFKDEDTFNAYFTELKKFFDVARDNNGSVAMISQDVDEVWHQFLLFTTEYMDMTQKHFGTFLHHVPNLHHDTTDTQGIKNFVDGYEARFGELPPEKFWGDINNVQEICSKCNMIEHKLLNKDKSSQKASRTLH